MSIKHIRNLSDGVYGVEYISSNSHFMFVHPENENYVLIYIALFDSWITETLDTRLDIIQEALSINNPEHYEVVDLTIPRIEIVEREEDYY